MQESNEKGVLWTWNVVKNAIFGFVLVCRVLYVLAALHGMIEAWPATEIDEWNPFFWGSVVLAAVLTLVECERLGFRWRRLLNSLLFLFLVFLINLIWDAIVGWNV